MNSVQYVKFISPSSNSANTLEAPAAPSSAAGGGLCRGAPLERGEHGVEYDDVALAARVDDSGALEHGG